MQRRFVSIWFRYLKTDWFSIRHHHLRALPFVLRTADRGRIVISAANRVAEQNGVVKGMVLADARAVISKIEVLDDPEGLSVRLLNRLAEWCICFSPSVAVDGEDGILIEATGCTHLWGGESHYISDIKSKLNARGYNISISMADTIGLAWGAARFGKGLTIVAGENHYDTLLQMPPEALRLEEEAVDRLNKLGLRRVSKFINIPRTSLRRRFGPHLLRRMDMAMGREPEEIQPVRPIEPYIEELPSLEPIVTAHGIEIALKQLLETLCLRLRNEQKGLRKAIFKCYRVDRNIQWIDVGTTRAVHDVNHLFKLFEAKLQNIEPALGIELFTLEALKIEDNVPGQERIWEGSKSIENPQLSQLIDRIANKFGHDVVKRYLPDEHYWPERSYKLAGSLLEQPATDWVNSRMRPLQLLVEPENIEVSAPIPDYPPMLFRHNGKVHNIIRADGPERIEQEWWLQQGQHRDYYRVEDEEGSRYWLFRLGHYNSKSYKWFLHGFFA